MARYKVLDFPLHSDDRGDLIPFELDESFPFAVKRVYLVTANDQAVRGGHAHKIESEVFVAAQGTIKARIHDGDQETIITLDKKNKGLMVEPYCWHEFYDFSDDAVMLCFSSTHYLPGQGNYITDETAFQAQHS